MFHRKPKDSSSAPDPNNTDTRLFADTDPQFAAFSLRYAAMVRRHPSKSAPIIVILDAGHPVESGDENMQACSRATQTFETLEQLETWQRSSQGRQNKRWIYTMEATVAV